jgi:hypothetical protein
MKPNQADCSNSSTSPHLDFLQTRLLQSPSGNGLVHFGSFRPKQNKPETHKRKRVTTTNMIVGTVYNLQAKAASDF